MCKRRMPLLLTCVTQGGVSDRITHRYKHMIRTEAIGLGIVLGIVGGLTANAYQHYPVEIVYAQEEVQEEPKEVLIEVRVDWTPERIEKEIRDTFQEDPDE